MTSTCIRILFAKFQYNTLQFIYLRSFIGISSQIPSLTCKRTYRTALVQWVHLTYEILSFSLMINHMIAYHRRAFYYIYRNDLPIEHSTFYRLQHTDHQHCFMFSSNYINTVMVCMLA